MSCEKSVIDSDANMSRKEFSDFMTLKNVKKDNDSVMELSNKSTPPNISKLLVSPPPPPIGNGNLVSFSVTEEVPVKDALIELGRIADVDMEIDPRISGGIILKITNKPLNVVVKRIADLAGLKYTYSNNILRFEKDLPYTETYNVDFLIDNDVWGTIESALNEIITFTLPSNVGADIITTTTPQQAGQQSGNKTSNSGNYKIIINKPSSMITVYANEKTQKAVKNYIDQVKINYASQVLIEAKVVEVVLNDDYKAGIDWSFTNGDKGGLTTGYADGSFATAPGGISGNITTAIFGGSLTAAINALQTFGLTKTISSPRVHAMNNQKADLKFISKLIYFSLEKDEETDTDTTTTTTTYTSTKQEEDIGVTLSIIPSIDLQNNEVTLKVVPELKVKVGEVADPTNELNKVPIIQSRSVETSLKVKSGNILVIGGLMSEDTVNTDTGIPYLSGILGLGLLFKSTSKTKEVRETVIFIKATIIKPNGEIEKYDREMYKKFGRDKDNY
ncbi:MAG: hypothetical protein PHY80_02355 [Rickettsiales bacterium]|nr:hypothetical protein [Rickettsiales bacterium]